MRRWGWLGIIGVVMAMGAGAAQADDTSELILQLLVKKGLVSQQEVDEIRQHVSSSTASATPGAIAWRWKDGLRFGTADEAFAFKLSGRVMADAAWMREDDNLQSRIGAKGEDAAEIRRARLGMSGRLYDRAIFEVEGELTDGLNLKDAYVGMERLPYVGTAQLGQFKEPFSLEEQTSSKYITFMERALPNALAPGRNFGLMFTSPVWQERAVWAAGVFRDTDEDSGGPGGTGGGEYNLTARLTALPWYEDEGERLLHLGAAYSHRAVNGNAVQYRARPEAHLAPRVVDTGSFTADNVDLFGQEAALVMGPLSLQGEWVTAAVDSGPQDDPALFGFYASASYFFTGERRPYDTQEGVFGRVRPRRNFNWEGLKKGPGAWEVALRYSMLDLSDELVSGRELRDVTLGLNWYLNPNTRAMLNYVFADLEGPGEMNAVQTRLQVDF